MIFSTKLQGRKEGEKNVYLPQQEDHSASEFFKKKLRGGEIEYRRYRINQVETFQSQMCTSTFSWTGQSFPMYRLDPSVPSEIILPPLLHPENLLLSGCGFFLDGVHPYCILCS